MFRILAVAACVMSVSAFAASKPRIAIQSFKGSPKAKLVQKQLQTGLCKAFSCVKAGKASDVEVAAVVTAEVSSGKNGAVTFSVYFDEDAAPITREFTQKAPGKLPASAVKEATRAVKEALAQSETASGDDDGGNTLAAQP